MDIELKSNTKKWKFNTIMIYCEYFCVVLYKYNLMKKKNIMHRLAICLFLAAITSLQAIVVAQSTLVKLSLEGNTAYHVNTGNINGIPVVFSATYHGKVFCHTQTGEFLWKADAGEGFPFDLESADIDGDGNHEAFVASSDGTLYAFNHDGTSLWTFSVEAPLYQVSAIITESSSSIFTGGIDKKIYKIDKLGQLSREILLNGAIRLISSGKVLGDSTPELVVTTTRSALMGNVSMYLFDPSVMNQIWMKNISQTLASNQTDRIFSLQIFDIDNDGKEEILCGHDHNMPDKFTLVQDNGSYGQITTSVRPKTSPYTMNLIHYIHGPGIENDYLLNHYANRLFLISKTGQILEEITAKYAFTNSHYDSTTSTLFFGSAVSGGDGVYGFRLDQSGWKNLYRTVQPVGTMVKMEANLKLLEQQIDNFTAPDYQPPVTPIQASIADWKYHQLPSGYFKNVVLSDYLSWSENYDRSFMPLPWRDKRDRRKPYNMTFEEIIQIAKNREKAGNPFFLWAGHGMDPFYMRMETLEEVLKVAPTTLKAFVFAEMEDSDESMRYVVDNLFRPLAELCLKNGNTKIFFRNKNIYWSGQVYLDVWADLFEDERLKSVFIAGLEETNSRTQTLSLYSRMGMLQTDRMGEIGCRPVTDNANFTRTWEWCQLQRMSHQIRAGAIARIMGANSFVQDIHTNTELELAPLYEMMDKGILPMVPPENIISVSDVAVSIKSPPNSRYISTGVNGHNIAGYQPGSPKMVFDRLDCFWGGAPVPEWDFTNYAFNSKRRMTNFIARAPYGNIAVIPDDTDMASSRFTKFLRTDGRYWYDESGQARQPDEYKDYVISQLEEAAERLPIRVLGDVSWGALLLDSNHYRVVLIDPGYADPADRQAVIKLQISGIDKAIDILSGEELAINSDQISLTVPMGILRVIDLIKYPSANVKVPDQKEPSFTIFPNPAKNGFSISTSSESYSYKVLDINGRIRSEGIGSYTNFIPAEDLKPGVYMIFLNTDNHSYVNRVVLL
jgi:lambda-carrageenase